jgi:hypothetical protein
MDEPDEDAGDGVDLSTAEGVDLSMAESNAASVEDVATEANDASLPALTRPDLNLGRFAVTKVSGYSDQTQPYHNHPSLYQLQNQPNESLTAPPSMQISRLPARRVISCQP